MAPHTASHHFTFNELCTNGNGGISTIVNETKSKTRRTEPGSAACRASRQKDGRI
jgi:hypothetical protein